MALLKAPCEAYAMLQVHLRKDLFCLASACDAGDHIVCCADSEDIRNQWRAVFLEHGWRLGIDVATKLGADGEEYLCACLTGVEIHRDALEAQLACSLRRLEEQQTRAWRSAPRGSSHPVRHRRREGPEARFVAGRGVCDR
jgi:hypothetical protein